MRSQRHRPIIVLVAGLLVSIATAVCYPPQTAHAVSTDSVGNPIVSIGQVSPIAIGNPIGGTTTPGDVSGFFVFNTSGGMVDWNLALAVGPASFTFTPADSTVGLLNNLNPERGISGDAEHLFFQLAPPPPPFLNVFVHLVVPGELGENFANVFIAAQQPAQLITLRSDGTLSCANRCNPFAQASEISVISCVTGPGDETCLAARNAELAGGTFLLGPAFMNLSDPPDQLFGAVLTSVVATPEPTSIVLLGTGLVALGAVASRRMRGR